MVWCRLLNLSRSPKKRVYRGIDKSFIDEIVTSSVEKSIVELIVVLSQKLQLRVIAEGVETQDQLDCLKACGCTYIQGYYISKPLPQEDAFLFAKNGYIQSSGEPAAKEDTNNDDAT
jgi:EAL domain-containing protein (putative c-di-GMP-specific phosphodiesterase class I)